MQVLFRAWIGLPLAGLGGGVAVAALATGAVPLAAALLGGVAATVGHHFLFTHPHGQALKFNFCVYLLATLGFNYVRLGMDATTGEILVLQLTTFKPAGGERAEEAGDETTNV